jgi:PPOX class probable F420-dependent enzyme
MLDPAVKQLATEKNFCTINFLLPNGQIGSHVMWVDASDDHILINTEVHRAKYGALQADPRVTVTIWDADNAYRYAEVRGRLAGEVRGPEARDHIDSLARKYTGNDYAARIESERVILRIAPERQRARGV